MKSLLNYIIRGIAHTNYVNKTNQPESVSQALVGSQFTALSIALEWCLSRRVLVFGLASILPSLDDVDVTALLRDIKLWLVDFKCFIHPCCHNLNICITEKRLVQITETVIWVLLKICYSITFFVKKGLSKIILWMMDPIFRTSTCLNGVQLSLPDSAIDGTSQLILHSHLVLQMLLQYHVHQEASASLLR